MSEEVIEGLQLWEIAALKEKEDNREFERMGPFSLGFDAISDSLEKIRWHGSTEMWQLGTPFLSRFEIFEQFSLFVKCHIQTVTVRN